MKRLLLNLTAIKVPKNRFLVFVMLAGFFFCFPTFQGYSAERSYDITEEKEEEPSSAAFEVEMSVGIIDLTIGKTDVSGNVEPITDSDEYQKEVYVNGRIAFYLKGKIKGKYLLTAQLDTGDEPIEKILDRLGEKDPRKVFDKIDPDKYYPVYGDDSTLINDTESQGKFYVSLEWDNSRVLWGNYQIRLNDNELAPYNRSLYGLNMTFKKSDASPEKKPAGTKLFWAEAMTLHSRDVLKPTGGSLYYLKNADLVVGSEQISLEVRDGITGEVVRTIRLEYGRDYELDYLQGRLILQRSLGAVIDSETIISGAPDDGDWVYLVADYEFEADHEANHSSYGLQASRYLSDRLRIGGVFVSETQENGGDYLLYGGNYQLKLSENTYFTGEWTTSESSLANRFYSEDGGLTYGSFPNGETTQGDAWKVGFSTALPRVNADSPWFNLDLSYIFREMGFSTSSSQTLNDTREYSAKLSGVLAKGISVLLKHSAMEEEAVKESKVTVLQLKQDYQRLTVTEELKNQSINREGEYYEETLGALRFDFRLNAATTLYAGQQWTLEHNAITLENNRTTLGADFAVTDKFDLNLEGSTGNLGDSVSLGGNYILTPEQRVYGKIESVSGGYDGQSFRTTVGNKSKLSEKVGLYTEHQLAYGTYEDSISDLFGVDYNVKENWMLTFDYTQSNVDKKAERPVHYDYPFSGIVTGETGAVDRTVIGGGISYKNTNAEYKTRLQWRDDDGADDLTQYVMTNLFKWKKNEALSYSLKLNYSLTSNDIDDNDLTRFVEASLGFAYRPVENDRLNIIGAYTYLEDLSPVEQIDGTLPGERSHVFSLEWIYDLSERWQWGEKLAYKRSEILLEADNWIDNDIYLWVNRLNYHFLFKWDIYAEYRMLWDKLTEDEKRGFLLAVYYHLNETSKFGVGYNFTDFNDDLTDLDYHTRGWFINLIKKW